MPQTAYDLGPVDEKGHDSHFTMHTKHMANIADHETRLVSLEGLGALSYKGVWDASTNTPALVSGAGTKGAYYKVSTAGTTALDGNANWYAGDVAVFNGTAWDRIDGGSTEVVSVAGRTGAITLASTDLSDFVEASQDVVGALVAAAGGNYNDTAGTITLPSVAGYDPATPSILRGSFNISYYSGVTIGALPGTTERTANGTALQAALDYAATNNKYAEVLPGSYEYIAQATQNSRNTGLHVRKGVQGLIGAGCAFNGGTLFKQFATNHPVLTIGDVGTVASDLTEGGYFRGFSVGHGASQAGQTSADGLLLGRIWKSSFDDLDVSPFFGGGHPYCGLRIGLSTSQFFFSNRIGTVTVRGGQAHLFRQDTNGTGNDWGNIYLGGGTFGNRIALSAEAFWANMSGCEFGRINQLNIEWCASPRLLRSEATTLSIGHLHMEGDQLTGFDPAMIHAVQGDIRIETMRMLDIMMTSAAATGTPRILSAYGDSRISVGQLNARWNGAGYNAEAVANITFRLYSDDTSIVGRKPFVDVGHADLSGHTGTLNLDANTLGAAPGVAGAITSFKGYSFNKARSMTDGASIAMGNAALTVYGQHRNAKVAAGTALTANRILTLSDKMAASGSLASARRAPGDIVTVHRTAAATGAFDLIVQGPNGQVLGTFSGAASAGTEQSFEWTGDTFGNDIAAPTGGAHVVGEYVRNTTPTEQGSAGAKFITSGWTCVVAGTPGTWVANNVFTGN